MMICMNVNFAVKNYFDLSYTEYAIAFFIQWRGRLSIKYRRGEDYGSYSYTEISTEHKCDRKTAINAVKKLVKLGLVELNPSNKQLKRTTNIWTNAHSLNNDDQANIVKKIHDATSGKIPPVASGKIPPPSGKIPPVASGKIPPDTYNRKGIIDIKSFIEDQKTTEDDLNEPQREKIINEKNIPRASEKVILISKAQKKFETARQKFWKNQGGEADNLIWTKPDLKHLKTIVENLKKKLTANQIGWQNDEDFLENQFSEFLDRISMLSGNDIWFNKNFSLAGISYRFNDYCDLIKTHKNGDSNNAQRRKQKTELVSKETALAAWKSFNEKRKRESEWLYGE